MTLLTKRDIRIFGMMQLFGILTSLVFANTSFAGPVIFSAVILGGFLGHFWDLWRVSTETKETPPKKQ